MKAYLCSSLHPILKYLCIPAHKESNENPTHKRGRTACLRCPTQTLESKKKEKSKSEHEKQFQVLKDWAVRENVRKEEKRKRGIFEASRL